MWHEYKTIIKHYKRLGQTSLLHILRCSQRQNAPLVSSSAGLIVRIATYHRNNFVDSDSKGVLQPASSRARVRTHKRRVQLPTFPVVSLPQHWLSQMISWFTLNTSLLYYCIIWHQHVGWTSSQISWYGFMIMFSKLLEANIVMAFCIDRSAIWGFFCQPLQFFS